MPDSKSKLTPQEKYLSDAINNCKVIDTNCVVHGGTPDLVIQLMILKQLTRIADQLEEDGRFHNG